MELLEWADYICMLAVALDQDEIKSYERFILAGGESKKWKWSHPDLAWRMGGQSAVVDTAHRYQIETTDVMEGVMQAFSSTRGVNQGKFSTVNKGSLEEAAGILHHMGLDNVQRVELDVDAFGNPIIPDGMVFIPYEGMEPSRSKVTIMSEPETTTNEPPPFLVKRL